MHLLRPKYFYLGFVKMRSKVGLVLLSIGKKMSNNATSLCSSLQEITCRLLDGVQVTKHANATLLHLR